MGYRLLGWATWKGAKWVLRRRFGGRAVPVPMLAGGLVAGALGVALAVRRGGRSSA